MAVSIEIQAGIYTALTTSAAVLALVPIGNITDQPNGRLPSISIGDIVEAADDISFERRHVRLAINLHTFVRENGSPATKALQEAIRVALQSFAPDLPTGMKLVDFRMDTRRVMRDAKDPEIAHGIIGFDALVERQS